MKFLAAIALLALPFGGQITQALPVTDLTTKSSHHALEPRQNDVTVQFLTRDKICGTSSKCCDHLARQSAFGSVKMPD